MKGYLDSKTKTLYIFPQEAAAIPTIAGAEKIAIQQEDLAAWKEANESYADMMFAYNYLLLSVQPKAWSEHENEDLGYDIALATGSDTYIEAPATAVAGSTVTITPKTGYSPVNVNIACEEAVVTPGTNDWTFTMPESDVELSATSDDHTITLTGTDASNFTLNKQTALAGETIVITPTDAIYYDAYVTLTASTPCGLAWNNDNTNWTCTMPDTDLTLTTSRTSYTLTLTGDNILEYTDVNINNEYVTNTGEWEVNANDHIKIEYRSSTGTYNIIQEPNGATPIIDGLGGTEFNMPAEDTEVIIDFVDSSSSSSAGE